MFLKVTYIIVATDSPYDSNPGIANCSQFQDSINIGCYIYKIFSTWKCTCAYVSEWLIFSTHEVMLPTVLKISSSKRAKKNIFC